MKHLILLTILLPLSGMRICKAAPTAQTQGMMPGKPQMLFPILPGQVEGFKLTKSKGSRKLGDWFETRISRTFVQTITPGTRDPSRPPEVRLAIKDTGKFEKSLSSFENFKPMKSADGNFERTLVAGNPVIISKFATTVRARFLIRNRFIIEIQTQRMPDKALKQWYQKLNLNRLNSLADSSPISLPGYYHAINIDELNPGKNSTAKTIISARPPLESEGEHK